jgi:hypothetical protein
MKFGVLNSSVSYDGNGVREKTFDYWILPSKPMSESLSGAKCATPMRGSWTEWDQDATRKQTASIKGFLTNSLEPGTWMESNHRFYFQNKEDWEMFKTMCLLGWQ